MKHRKGSYRFDVTDDVRKIEADAWKNARALGFTTLAEIYRELNRLGRQRGPWKHPERERFLALANISSAIDFVQHFDRQVKAMLASATALNNGARRWIDEAAKLARDSETRARKAA
jgi:hypothetical protein